MSFMIRCTMTAVLCAVLGGVASAQPYFARAQVVTAPEANNDFVNSADVDGEWAAAGGERTFNTQGQAGVFIFRRGGSGWAPFQRLSCPATGTVCASFGRSVALSGTTLAVSAGGSNLYTGEIWVYAFNGATWSLQTTLVPPTGKHLGDWMALDGNYLVTSGAVNNSSANWEAYVFERSGGTWTRRVLTGVGRTTSDRFGLGVGISGDRVCVLAPGAASPAAVGAVHVFQRSGSDWVQDGPRLTPSSVPGALVPGSCTIQGDTLLVGAPNQATQGQPGSGRIYAYSRSGGAWTLPQTLVADADTHGLGATLAVRGDALVAGANQSESVLFFVRVAGTWVERGRDQNPVADANLGDEVASDGATFVVGGRRTAFGVGVLAFYVPSNTPPNRTGPPGAPTGFDASVSGNLVTFSWAAPTTGAPPTSYTLVARTTGGALLTTLSVGAGSSYAVTAPNGIYAVSIRAANTSGSGPESAPVTVTVPAAVAAPGAPVNLAASVAGDTVSFTWAAPASGGSPAGYTLLAGLTPGFSVAVAALPLGPMPRTATVPSVPAGIYYVRLVAQNAGGTSPASNEVVVTVAGLTAPGTPTLNPATVGGGTVGLSWVAGGGGPASSYVLTATSPAGAVLATVPIAGTSASFTGVPSGTYLVRIVASNAAGSSAPSNTVTVVVP